MQHIGNSQNPHLKLGEVHLWSNSLLIGRNEFAAFEKTLSDDERRRANAFRFEHDRRRFVAARGQLRALLGHYSDVPAAEVVIRAGVHGKPYLHYPSELIHFNVSHTGDKAIIAFCPDGPVGVDIEELKRETWLNEIAETFCTGGELDAIRRLPTDDHPRELLRLWTAKEAFLKALGKGLQVALDEIELLPGALATGDFRWATDPGLSDFFQHHPLPFYERSGYCASLVTLKGIACSRLFWHRFRNSQLKDI
ncbi:MAG: 4'-phosphopantetheinyl transferase superfamily protein [Verrucomicrobiota bacterium]